MFPPELCLGSCISCGGCSTERGHWLSAGWIPSLPGWAGRATVLFLHETLRTTCSVNQRELLHPGSHTMLCLLALFADAHQVTFYRCEVGMVGLAVPRPCQHLLWMLLAAGRSLCSPGISLPEETLLCTEIYCCSTVGLQICNYITKFLMVVFSAGLWTFSDLLQYFLRVQYPSQST